MLRLGYELLASHMNEKMDLIFYEEMTGENFGSKFAMAIRTEWKGPGREWVNYSTR